MGWAFCFGISRVYGAPTGTNRATLLGGQAPLCPTPTYCVGKRGWHGTCIPHMSHTVAVKHRASVGWHAFRRARVLRHGKRCAIQCQRNGKMCANGGWHGRCRGWNTSVAWVVPCVCFDTPYELESWHGSCRTYTPLQCGWHASWARTTLPHARLSNAWQSYPCARRNAVRNEIQYQHTTGFLRVGKQNNDVFRCRQHKTTGFCHCNPKVTLEKPPLLWVCVG